MVTDKKYDESLKYDKSYVGFRYIWTERVK